MNSEMKGRIRSLGQLFSNYRLNHSKTEKHTAECSVLLLPEDSNLKSAVRHSLPLEWAILSARSTDEAVMAVVSGHIPVVVCCETNSLDWREAVRLLSGPPCNASVIVIAATVTQAIWDSTVYLGGYDVLPASADPDRMFAVIRSAWSEWKNARALGNASALIRR
jgi:DNA-binding NtrC family response regulator